MAFTPNQTQRPLILENTTAQEDHSAPLTFPAGKHKAAAATLSASRKPEHITKWKNKGKMRKTYCPTSPRPEVVFRTVSGIFVAKAFMPGREGGLKK